MPTLEAWAFLLFLRFSDGEANQVNLPRPPVAALMDSEKSCLKAIAIHYAEYMDTLVAANVKNGAKSWGFKCILVQEGEGI